MLFHRFPAAGYRYGNTNAGKLVNGGSNGRYWSSSPYDGTNVNAGNLNFNNGNVNPRNNNNRAYANSVRCVSEFTLKESFRRDTCVYSDCFFIGFPASGFRWGDSDAGKLANGGTNGRYWSSSPYDATGVNAGNLNFNNGNINTKNNNNRANGYSVRCVSELGKKRVFTMKLKLSPEYMRLQRLLFMGSLLRGYALEIVMPAY